ncbi:PREDICTED: plant UBX domain-containing protein 10-like [Tarenaya hassleriana]|uniref:plant UBX domain-containing protein 10-like n=1 Tax=Tarenaya hassleriana TaxID=28532 RepID=UPI00053C5ACA|nr:PREDICTED: plant UBX domain-containing protein 10-like [Tarenaya hassleriana]
MARRMFSLPWNLLGGFPRSSRPRNNPSDHGFPEPISQIQYQNNPLAELPFLSIFEQNYGANHPFFYACKLSEALKMAGEEKKLVFVYLHDLNHPFTPSFCRETLCSEIVIQFLDVNFVSWGTISNRDEGANLVATLRPGSFPCCVVLTSTGNGDYFAVVRQIEGPVSPEQLVEILQRTMEEQGLSFQFGKLKEQEKITQDRRLREEQDAAYLAAIQIDREKERTRRSNYEKAEKQRETPKPRDYEKQMQTQTQTQNQTAKAREQSGSIDTRNMRALKTSKGSSGNTAKILIRFPDGERRETSFSGDDTIESVYRYIDSLGKRGIRAYRLVSGFPRRTYGYGEMNMALKDAGLYPRASLFLELIP